MTDIKYNNNKIEQHNNVMKHYKIMEVIQQCNPPKAIIIID